LLKFWINGVETPVIVDDYLPVRNGKCAFAACKGDEMWVSLLEKGWAKLHGSYQRTEGGQPVQAAIHMMGVPSSNVTHSDLKTDDDKKTFWIQLCDSDKRNYVMMSSSLGQGEQKSESGIYSGHAYSLIGAFEF
jgi:hypothetical protein